MTQSQVLHQRLLDARTLGAWEPVDGHAIVTCKIRVHDTWEPRVYEFLRVQEGWVIDTNPGLLKREHWEHVVDWFCRVLPIEIDLVTTVKV